MEINSTKDFCLLSYRIINLSNKLAKRMKFNVFLNFYLLFSKPMEFQRTNHHILECPGHKVLFEEHHLVCQQSFPNEGT